MWATWHGGMRQCPHMGGTLIWRHLCGGLGEEGSQVEVLCGGGDHWEEVDQLEKLPFEGRIVRCDVRERKELPTSKQGGTPAAREAKQAPTSITKHQQAPNSHILGTPHLREDVSASSALQCSPAQS